MRYSHRFVLRATVALLSTGAALVAASSVTPAHAAVAEVDILYAYKKTYRNQQGNLIWQGNDVYFDWHSSYSGSGYVPESRFFITGTHAGTSGLLVYDVTVGGVWSHTQPEQTTSTSIPHSNYYAHASITINGLLQDSDSETFDPITRP